MLALPVSTYQVVLCGYVVAQHRLTRCLSIKMPSIDSADRQLNRLVPGASMHSSSEGSLRVPTGQSLLADVVCAALSTRLSVQRLRTA